MWRRLGKLMIKNKIDHSDGKSSKWTGMNCSLIFFRIKSQNREIDTSSWLLSTNKHVADVDQHEWINVSNLKAKMMWMCAMFDHQEMVRSTIKWIETSPLINRHDARCIFTRSHLNWLYLAFATIHNALYTMHHTYCIDIQTDPAR